MEERGGYGMKEKNGEHPFGDTGQLIALGLFLVVWIGDSFFLHVSTFPSRMVPLYGRLIVSGLAIVSAIFLVRSGHTVISHGQRPADIVETGAFKCVRHPLYLGSILTYFALAVSTASLGALVLLVGIVSFYDYIAGYEERLLEARFGGRYGEYRKRTGKWIPRFTRKRPLS
jgi:protein-S-isoprenylcysteine O-methyltransferase Ste14